MGTFRLEVDIVSNFKYLILHLLSLRFEVALMHIPYLGLWYTWCAVWVRLPTDTFFILNQFYETGEFARLSRLKQWNWVWKTQKYSLSKCLLRHDVVRIFCVVPCVSFCTGHSVMMPLNMTYLHFYNILCLNISSIYIESA